MESSQYHCSERGWAVRIEIVQASQAFELCAELNAQKASGGWLAGQLLDIISEWKQTLLEYRYEQICIENICLNAQAGNYLAIYRRDDIQVHLYFLVDKMSLCLLIYDISFVDLDVWYRAVGFPTNGEAVGD